MTTNFVKWASEHGQMAKIKSSDDCGDEVITMVVQFEYDRHGFEVYLGNVGSKWTTQMGLITMGFPVGGFHMGNPG